MSLRQIGTHGLVLFAGEVLSRIGLFLCTVLLARRLGPDAFGLVTFAQVVLGYVLLVSDWGLTTHGVRVVAADPASASRTWPGITRVRFAIALAIVGLAAVVTFAARPAPLTSAVLLGSLAIALPSALATDWTLRGLGRMRSAALLSALPAIGWLAGILLFVHGPQQVVLVPLLRLLAVGIAAGTGFAMLGGFPFAGRAAAEGSAWLREHGARRLVGSGSVLLLANLAVLAYNSADHLLLRGLIGDRAVGLYAGAYRVIQLPLAALYTLTTSALPALVRLEATDVGRSRETSRRLLGLAGVAGLGIAVVLWVLREPIVALVFGPAYAATAPLLGVLALVVPLDFLVSVKGTAYIAAGRERAAGTCAGISAAANVIANLLLIPRYGMMGSAWTTVGTYVLLAALYRLFLDDRRVFDRRDA